MFASLSKLADRNFVVGFFLPTLLAVLAALAVFGKVPWFQYPHGELGSTEKLGDITGVVVTVWLCGVLLLAVNYWLYRFFEGYLWPISAIPFLRNRQVRRFRELNRRLDGTADPVEEAWLRIALFNSFPSREEWLLPTRFGNAIRAFEVYAVDIHGADAVAVWFHLMAVASKDYLGFIDAARAQVDFFLNLCVLAILFAAAVLVQLGWDLDWRSLNAAMPLHEHLAVFTRGVDFCVVGPALAGSVAVAFIAHWWALASVPAWGSWVKAAFDLYLPDLAEKLGFEHPRTLERRKQFWTDVSQRAAFGDPFRPEDWPQVKPAAKAETAKDDNEDAAEDESG
ncbi:MAG: hypothetical protein P4L83_25020 [Nevskia sp.]|nr:hypothetical protein [Nevskia sp.]